MSRALICFFDASALVKRYVTEDGSATVEDLLIQRLPAVARLTEVEVASALERRCREGSFEKAERDRAITALRRDIQAFLVVEMTSAVVERAMALLARHPLRTEDALQLASALELRHRLEYKVSFSAFDRRLGEAARQEGLELETAP